LPLAAAVYLRFSMHLHVEGHQDDTKAFHSLDHWGQLNSQADSLAKEHITLGNL
jgi:hypothetical protein